MKKEVIVFGHRGAKGYVAENTIASIQKAYELTAKWVEFDIYNVDNELVLFHDYTLERTTNGDGCIAKVGLDYLRSIDAGKGEKVPFLKEVLDTFQGRLNFNIELKGPDTALLLNTLLEEYIREGKYSIENFIISSFDHRELSQVSTTYRRAPLFASIPLHLNDCIKDLNPYSVHYSSYYISKELVEDAHSRGYRVYTYTVNDEYMFEKVMSCGVDGIISDFPDRIMSLLS